MLGIERFWAIIIIAALSTGIVRFAPIVPRRYRVAASIAVMLAFLCWMPFTVNNFRTGQLTTIATWGIVAVGLNILTGYNGQISLGHGAFVIIGAYTAAILTDSKDQLGFVDASPWPFWAAMIMSGVVAAAAGIAVGVPSLRLSGPYLAVATLSLMIAMPSVLQRYDSLTGGRTGLQVPQPPPPPFLEHALNRQEWYFFLALITACLLVLLAWYMVQSRWGKAFVAVRDSEVAALAVGISVSRYKVLAFTISAFFAGIAGALFVFAVTGYMSPESIGLVLSINYFTAIVIGGLGSLMGSIIGGFIVVLLPELSTKLGELFVGTDRANRLWPSFYGAILIVVIIVMPYGIAGFLHRLSRLRRSEVGAWITGLPAAVSARVRQVAEDVSWTWDVRFARRESKGKPSDSRRE